MISYWVESWEKKKTNYKPLIEMINLISVWLYIDYVFRLFIYFAIHEMFFLNWSHHFRICGGVCACACAHRSRVQRLTLKCQPIKFVDSYGLLATFFSLSLALKSTLCGVPIEPTCEQITLQIIIGATAFISLCVSFWWFCFFRCIVCIFP